MVFVGSHIAHATNESSYKLGYMDAIQTMRCALVKGSCSTTNHNYSNAVTNETAYGDGWRNTLDHVIQHNPIQYGYIFAMRDGKSNIRDSLGTCGDVSAYNQCEHGYNLGFRKVVISKHVFLLHPFLNSVHVKNILHRNHITRWHETSVTKYS